MENEYIDKYEETLRQQLYMLLRTKGEIDERMPDAPDIEEKWESLGRAYLPDGVREFNGYPTVSLGWIFFVGMAVAKFWDVDWAKYAAVDDLYATLRDVRGYDCMDEYICEVVLQLDSDATAEISELALEVSRSAHHALMHAGFEAGTTEAFHAYVRTLHQLYLFGAAVQLRRMGYHMTKIS